MTAALMLVVFLVGCLVGAVLGAVLFYAIGNPMQRVYLFDRVHLFDKGAA